MLSRNPELEERYFGEGINLPESRWMREIKKRNRLLMEQPAPKRGGNEGNGKEVGE